MTPRILAIYDADSTFLGELAYTAGKLIGARQCALCDISHGLNPLGKKNWRGYCHTRPDVEWLHRNELSPQILADLPCGLPGVVLLATNGTQTVLMDQARLSACHGDITRFDETLSIALAEARASDDASREPELA